ncbi:MAG: helix-turn-helix domain-containing protein [Gammaproteobacteria bacterium]|nr:helix-turn-helix domain-containing protein [Gammaproteobacteria bacterium]
MKRKIPVGENFNIGSAAPSLTARQQARLSRDQRFDGRFIIAVVTTGVYCRPSCPARIPKEENVRYFVCGAGAQEAGYRACLRCVPDQTLPVPDWAIGNRHVVKGLAMIEAGFLNDHSIVDLAEALQLSPRHLDRLFADTLGASPLAIARIKRGQTAKVLLQQSTLKLSELAEHAGYGSVSQFNKELRLLFNSSPSALRRAKFSTSKSAVDKTKNVKEGEEHPLTLRVVLPVRMPYDFDWVFNYLKGRALTGIEEVLDGPHGQIFRRRLSKAGAPESWLRVERSGDELIAYLPLGGEPIYQLLRRLGRLFDLHTDGATLHKHLSADRFLAPWVKAAPGLRVPGAWDGFETCVRAILGQQVSVARGTELANAMIARYGGGDFPSPEQLVDKQIAELGMPGNRGRAISTVAQQVIDQSVTFDEGLKAEAFVEALTQIKGIGPWTVNYIRLRVLKDPDAFPHNDWVVLKQLDTTPFKAKLQAEPWQPWRAYGLMYLWYAASVGRAKAASEKKARAKQTEVKQTRSKQSRSKQSKSKQSRSKQSKT